MTDSTLSKAEQIQQWSKDNNITLSSIFVPFSASRNRLEKMKSLNYIVTLQSPTNMVSTDYMKGQGHLEYKCKTTFNFKNSPDSKESILRKAIDYSCESGIFWQGFQLLHDKKFPVPTVDEVLYCLASDSDVSNYPDFEDWANNCGYDTDSIKAKDVYEACQKTSKHFNKLFTKKQREELTELLQDY